MYPGGWKDTFICPSLRFFIPLCLRGRVDLSFPRFNTLPLTRIRPLIPSRCHAIPLPSLLLPFLNSLSRVKKFPPIRFPIHGKIPFELVASSLSQFYFLFFFFVFNLTSVYIVYGCHRAEEERKYLRDGESYFDLQLNLSIIK